MGALVNGVWHTDDVRTSDAHGHFVRAESAFRNWVSVDGRPGPTGEGGFAAERGRYHLYVSLACPWASRALMMRAWKGLEDIVSISVTHWLMQDQGWTFHTGPGVIADVNLAATYLHQIYAHATPNYTGKVTVPVLWDKQRQTIVNNESADILRMFNSAFDDVGAIAADYYPEPLRAEIDAINERVYSTINNGVYKAGFAKNQAAYEANIGPLFESLNWLDARLHKTRFLLGPTPTEADIRLFTTLVRFDSVYHGHFKCNLRRLVDYPALWSYTRDLYQWPKVADTVNFTHIKNHYYQSHTSINPTQIVPLGPELDWDQPADRS